MYTVSLASAYIPRLQQWQDLSKAQRRQFRQEKERLEQAHAADLQRAFKVLIARYSITE